jgi:POT family proton-dependent oligopeptide transporter
VWNVYPLWLRDHVDRSAFGTAIPVTWFQSIDASAVLLLAPAILLLWRAQRNRGAEPGDLSKVALGCALFAAAYALLFVGQWVAHGRPVALIWTLAFHLFTGLGYLYAAPVALALISRTAPPAVNAMMVGSYYLGIFAGGLISGRLARLYEPLGPAAFWCVHIGVALMGTLLLWVLHKPLLRALRLERPAPA